MSKNFELNQNYYTYRDNKTIPIVFIHGVGLDRKMWSPQISYFKNYSTITYDLLGHGKTPLNKENLTIWVDRSFMLYHHSWFFFM